MSRKLYSQSIFIALLFVCLTHISFAQTTAFNYQARLTDAGSPATGSFQMQFKLFDAVAGGNQIGATLTNVPATASEGVFSVKLDFGANALSGANRFLEIAVRRNSSESYVTLSPRESIASSPYAVRTLSAASADGLSGSCVGCVQDSNINSVSGTKVTGAVANATNATTAATATTAANSTQLGGVAASEYVTNSTLSTNAIRNQSTLQTPASFNISGNGFFGGNVGIGTTNPVSKLDVRGNLTFETGGSPGIFTSALSGEQNRFLSIANSPTTPTASGLKAGGLLVSDDYSFANPTKNDLIVKGNVGIGTNVLASKLNVSGLGYGYTHTNGLVTIGSYLDSSNSGGWFGTRSFHPLHFFTGNSLTPQMTLTTGGNFGIGTSTPPTRLALSGGPSWTSAGWKASMSLDNGAAIGWRANSAGYRAGIGQTDGGLYFFSTTGDFGTTSTAAAYDMFISSGGNVGIGTTTPTTARLVVANGLGNAPSIAIDGHARQERTSGGWAKAMLRVNAAGTILYCYNGVVNAAPNCGFFVSNFETGGYNIDFGFQVNDRFATVASEGCQSSIIYGAAPYQNFIQVRQFVLSGAAYNCAFTIVVY